MPTNQSIVVNFDGQYLSYTDLNGSLVRIPAISGRDGYQNPQHQGLADQGTLPSGTYYVNQGAYQQIDFYGETVGVVGIGTWPGSTKSWGTERVWLEPAPGTETYGRTGFTIHGGKDAGSDGCIDMVGNSSTFFDYFQDLGQDVILNVDYGSYDGSNHPLTDNVVGNNGVVTINDIYNSQGLSLDDLAEFKSQLKEGLEKQLNMSLTDEAFENIFNNQTLPDSNSFYAIQPGQTISDLAQTLEMSEQELIELNPWLESEGRISADGNFILIKANDANGNGGDKLVVPADKAALLDARYKNVETNEDGTASVSVNESGEAEEKTATESLTEAVNQDNGLTAQQNTQNWFQLAGETLSGWWND
ncbi:MAG: hypothetical protein ACJAS6_000562, partial [Rickettsiales bacterium]